MSKISITKVMRLEEDVIDMRTCLKKQEASLQDRDYYGTLHVNLLALAHELEKRFGFRRGGQ